MFNFNLLPTPAIYAKEVAGHLEKVSGKPLFGGEVERLMLGEVEDLWDKVAIAMYPSRKAMLEMISDPDYIQSAQRSGRLTPKGLSVISLVPGYEAR